MGYDEDQDEIAESGQEIARLRQQIRDAKAALAGEGTRAARMKAAFKVLSEN